MRTAHVKTVAKLVALTLWPAGVPIPDMALAHDWSTDVPRESNV